LRRPFEAVSRRIWGNKEQIQFGPLQGRFFQGGLAQILGIYEFAVQKVLYQQLQPGQVFYDVGANNGFLSLFASYLVGERGRVYAFEPFPPNVKAIETAIRQNQLTNCYLVSQAVAETDGEMHLYFEQSGSIATPSLLAGRSNQSITVQTVTLNSFIKKHPWPKLVKVDVEGAEALLLKGATDLLEMASAPSWLIEVHSAAVDQKIKAILDDYDYYWELISSLKRNKPAYPNHILAWKES
jgi:FkbM family methyltransferase